MSVEPGRMLMHPELYVSPTERVRVRPEPTSIPRPPTRYEPGAFEGPWGVALIVVMAIAGCWAVAMLSLILWGPP